MEQPALLALEDGTIFKGTALGVPSTSKSSPQYCVGEVVFNTALTGYQEVLTDPSYAHQLVTLTYPHIGNVGVNEADQESTALHAAGLIIPRAPIQPSNWRATETLQGYLLKNQKIGIANLDTRALTQHIRQQGAMRGCIYTAPTLDEDTQQAALALAQAAPTLKGQDLAKIVSVKQAYTWQAGGLWQQTRLKRPYTPRIVVYDFGVKHSILRTLDHLGCEIEVVPAQTPAEAILARQPDGVVLSNGPGDPAPCQYAIEAIKKLIQTDIPLLGICLGHQLLALACGAKTSKMKFGHHGTNHPVKAVETGRVMITSQNHGFTVDEASLPPSLVATHHALFDGTLQGFRHTEKPLMGFQGHPEAGPGPSDACCIFEDYLQQVETYIANTQTTMVTNEHA